MLMAEYHLKMSDFLTLEFENMYDEFFSPIMMGDITGQEEDLDVELLFPVAADSC